MKYNIFLYNKLKKRQYDGYCRHFFANTLIDSDYSVIVISQKFHTCLSACSEVFSHNHENYLNGIIKRILSDMLEFINNNDFTNISLKLTHY